MPRKTTQEEFVQKSLKLHDNKYDYSEVKYKNTYTKIKVICRVHGEFFQTPFVHLRGHGCNKCAHRLSKEDLTNLIKKINENYVLLDYSEYKDENSRITILNVENKVVLSRKVISLKYHINMNAKIAKLLRLRMRETVRAKKSKSAIKLLGCTIDQFRNHIEKQFEENMSWQNHGEWHFDHIKPCNTFDLSNEKEVEKCFHYTNIRPLWATENLKRKKK